MYHTLQLHEGISTSWAIPSSVLAFMQAIRERTPTLPCLQPPALLCQKSPTAHQVCMLAGAQVPTQDMPSIANHKHNAKTTVKQQTCYLLMCTSPATGIDSDI